MKKTIALFLVLTLVAALFGGCAGTKTPASESAKTSTEPTETTAPAPTGKTRPSTNGKADNTLTVAYSGTVSTIDPELFTAQDEDTVLSQIYEPLFLYNNSGEMAPYLAESWKENEDGSVDFVLRSGVKFHSGDDLNAEDVEYTLSRTQNSPVCSSLWGNVEITIADDTHFTFTFPNQDNGASWNDLTGFIQCMDIVNKSWAEGVISDPNDNLVYQEDGTGPYKFTSIESNGDITLSRFHDYWGKASIDTIYFKQISGSHEVAFESGDLDVAAYTSPSNFENIGNYSNVYTYSQPINRVSYITLRSGEGDTFADLSLRQAFVYAINREDLYLVGSDGAGQIAYNLATPLNQYYIDNPDHFERNLEKSKELLTAAGYSEANPMKIVLVANTQGATSVSVCEILKAELEESYFSVKIEETPDNTRIKSGDFDATVMSIGLLPSFGSYSLIFTLGTGLNDANVNDQDINEMFLACKTEADFQNAMKVTTENLNYIPLYYPSTLLAADGDLNVGEFNTSLTCFLFGEFSWK